MLIWFDFSNFCVLKFCGNEQKEVEKIDFLNQKACKMFHPVNWSFYEMSCL